MVSLFFSVRYYIDIKVVNIYIFIYVELVEGI